MKLDPPAWWNDRAVTMQEAASFLDVPFGTLMSWARIAALIRCDIIQKVASRNLMTCHDVYVAALLAEAARLGLPVNEGLIRVALANAYEVDGTPRRPDKDEDLQIIKADALRSRAMVQSWLIWSAVQHFGYGIMGREREEAA